MKGGRKRNIYLTRPVSSFHFFSLGMEGREWSWAEKALEVSMGPNRGTWVCDP